MNYRRIMDLPEIDTTVAKGLLESGDTVFVDVRDPDSYQGAHIPGAIHVDDATVSRFVAETAKDASVVVYCYHGHNSLGATAFFLDQGFKSVSSLSGGFAAWHESGGAVAQGEGES